MEAVVETMAARRCNRLSHRCHARGRRRDPDLSELLRREEALLETAGVRQRRDRRRRRPGSRQQRFGRGRPGADAYAWPADVGDRRDHAFGVPELRHQSGTAVVAVAAAAGVGPDRVLVHRQRHAARAQPAADRDLGEAPAHPGATPLCRHSRVRHHWHLWDHPVSGRPHPALSHRRHRLSYAPVRLLGRARHHRDDTRAAGGAELPSGHDDLGGRLDRVLHAAAVGDDPGAGRARSVRPQALSARRAAQARSRARRRVSGRTGCREARRDFASSGRGNGAIIPRRRLRNVARDCRIRWARAPPSWLRSAQLRPDVSNLGPPFFSMVSGISRKVSTSPAAPMHPRPRNATLLPSRSLIHPANVVLIEAPIPIPLPTMPWARLKRPVPRVISAIVSGTSTPNTAALMPSSSCTATSRRGSTTTISNRPRIGNAAKPASRIGRRPHRCAQRPTEGENVATTSCGTTMQAATNVVAPVLERMVTTLATSGSIAAFASWKTATHAANVKSGRLVRSVTKPAVLFRPCANPPWPRTGSISSDRI